MDAWAWRLLEAFAHMRNLMCWHARIQKVLLEGVQFWQLFLTFLVDWGGGGGAASPNTTINWPSSALHWNGVLLARWWWPNIECWLGSFVFLFQGIWPTQKRTLYFCDFQGVLTPCLAPPPLDPQMAGLYMYIKKSHTSPCIYVPH